MVDCCTPIVIKPTFDHCIVNFPNKLTHSRMLLKLIDVILTVEDMNSELDIIVVGEVADKLAAA